jgi:peptidyl-tRNA hydrolase, PTH1 family
MDQGDYFLIVGLGNPGASYEHTRHNVGFAVVRALAEKHKVAFKQASYALGEVARLQIGDKKVLLLLPGTFMNSSGDAVRHCVDYYKMSLNHLIVVCDDVALPVGVIRMRSKGGSGGHNGLENIKERLRTEHYARLRIGIGGPGDHILADYVLGRFGQDEAKMIEGVTPRAIEALEQWVVAGIASAMQKANGAENLS